MTEPAKFLTACGTDSGAAPGTDSGTGWGTPLGAGPARACLAGEAGKSGEIGQTGRIGETGKTGKSAWHSDRLDAMCGLCILIYLVDHFSVNCWGARPSDWPFGGAAVGLFFLVSGLRMYRSLAKRGAALGQGALSGRACLGFWRDRIIRIYPMYLIAAALMPIFFLAPLAWWQYLGADSPYWFINRILQCYLLAPALYYLAGSRRTWLVYAPFPLLIALNLGFFFGVALPSELAGGALVQFTYLRVWLSYLGLFYLGMLAGSGRIAAHGRISGHVCPGQGTGPTGPIGQTGQTGLTGLLACAGFTAMMLATSLPFPVRVSPLVCLAHALASLVFFVRFNSARVNATILKCLRFLGAISLPVYLFEPSYYLLLAACRLLAPRSYTTLALVILFSPLLFAACFGLQYLQNALAAKAKTYWN